MEGFFAMESILGGHESMLLLRAKRMEVLASNIANADTPGYKARDLDFAELLENTKEQQESNVSMMMTQQRHIATSNNGEEWQLKYRTPLQSSLDGNTVDVHVEQAKYSENSIEYMAILNFVQQRTNNILSVLKGE